MKCPAGRLLVGVLPGDPPPQTAQGRRVVCRYDRWEAGMEFKAVVGGRRSIRYYQPWRPVEREKIQTILEAARLSSRAVNGDFAKAIVVQRDQIPPEQRDGLKTPTTQAQLDLAPVWIFWYGNPEAPKGGPRTLKQLVDVGALGAPLGWSHAYVDEVIYPQVLSP